MVADCFNTANAREFRAVGYTINAAKFLLSAEAFERKKEFNKVPVGYSVPHAWKFAPNQHMKNYWEERKPEDDK